MANINELLIIITFLSETALIRSGTISFISNNTNHTRRTPMHARGSIFAHWGGGTGQLEGALA